jgi:hypothetical protein
MSHFTYQEPAKLTLNQGDVLKKTEAIYKILQDVHPHYLNEDYTHFIVLTQTCDLQRRESKSCNSPYITIAAVRPLRTALNRYVAQYQSGIIEIENGLVKKEAKDNIRRFLNKLLNNNYPEYFYLHEDINYDFAESSVAFLRLSVALKSELHYAACLESKAMELTEGFKAKLGWLVGNMYSRIGTPDWVPTILAEKSTFDQKIDETLKQYYQWVEKERLDKLKEAIKKEGRELQKEEILRRLDSIPTLKRKQIVVERIKTILGDSGIQKEDIEKIATNISNDPTISEFIKS